MKMKNRSTIIILRGIMKGTRSIEDLEEDPIASNTYFLQKGIYKNKTTGQTFNEAEFQEIKRTGKTKFRIVEFVSYGPPLAKK